MIKKLIFSLGLVIGVAFCATAQVDGYKWTVINTTNSYIPREECDFVNVKGKFYLIGGRKISPVEVFNPKTLTWSEAAPPPIEIHHFQALVYQNEVYVVMGMTGGYPHEKPLDHIYIFNAEQNACRAGAEIPA